MTSKDEVHLEARCVSFEFRRIIQCSGCSAEMRVPVRQLRGQCEACAAKQQQEDQQTHRLMIIIATVIGIALAGLVVVMLLIR